MDIVRFELGIFRIKPIRNVHDHPEIDVKLHEKVSLILLKSLFVQCLSWGSRIRTGLSELARHWFVAIRE